MTKDGVMKGFTDDAGNEMPNLSDGVVALTLKDGKDVEKLYNALGDALGENDAFFNRKNCERCGAELIARITSWFTTETICMDCSAKEDEIKAKLQEQGKKPSDFEGCGYIPKV